MSIEREEGFKDLNVLKKKLKGNFDGLVSSLHTKKSFSEWHLWLQMPPHWGEGFDGSLKWMPETSFLRWPDDGVCGRDSVTLCLSEGLKSLNKKTPKKPSTVFECVVDVWVEFPRAVFKMDALTSKKEYPWSSAWFLLCVRRFITSRGFSLWLGRHNNIFSFLAF